MLPVAKSGICALLLGAAVLTVPASTSAQLGPSTGGHLSAYLIAPISFMSSEDRSRLIGNKIASKLGDLGCALLPKPDGTLERGQKTELLRIWSQREGRFTRVYVTFRHDQWEIDKPVMCGTLEAEECAGNDLKLDRIVTLIREHHRECHQERPCNLTSQRLAF